MALRLRRCRCQLMISMMILSMILFRVRFSTAWAMPLNSHHPFWVACCTQFLRAEGRISGTDNSGTDSDYYAATLTMLAQLVASERHLPFVTQSGQP